MTKLIVLIKLPFACSSKRVPQKNPLAGSTALAHIDTAKNKSCDNKSCNSKSCNIDATEKNLLLKSQVWHKT